MRLNRLHVDNFAGIRSADIAFGPGLNVIYGPNDLGKSTLADAIRLVLLLPHTSTDCKPYFPWTGGGTPIVDLTFQTEAQRFWRVRKEFGKGGSSLLQESRDGTDFDDVEHARGVDGKLRGILGWGISEPGQGSGKGLPSSFLATALLSTQADVTAVLRDTLESDLTATGRERIASALQAVAQDPLFVALLRNAQARRDEAYTDKGAKKTAKGSIFKEAADRVNDCRTQKERLQQIVDDSEGVERQLRELVALRAQHADEYAGTVEAVDTLEALAKQAELYADAKDRLRIAQENVGRITKIAEDVKRSEDHLGRLAIKKKDAERLLNEATEAQQVADDALKVAEDAARSTGADAEMAETVGRQALELQREATANTIRNAQQRVDATKAAAKLVEAAAQAATEYRSQEAAAASARANLGEVNAALSAAETTLRRIELLERGLDARAAEHVASERAADVANEAALRAEFALQGEERALLAERRTAIVVPVGAGALVPMRKLAAEVAGARGHLDVGMVVTLIPLGARQVEVEVDGVAVPSRVIAEPTDLEAKTEIDIRFPDIATVRVRGGRRSAQEKVRSLEERWNREVRPHLAAANAEDIDGLEARTAEAAELEARIRAIDGTIETLQRQVAALSGSRDKLDQATAHAAASLQALGEVPLETIRPELEALGVNAVGALRSQKRQAEQDAEVARAAGAKAQTAQALAEERVQNLHRVLSTAEAARDAAIATFTVGLFAAESTAFHDLSAALAIQENVALQLASADRIVEERRQRADKDVTGKRAAAHQGRMLVEAAREGVTSAVGAEASEAGRLDELRKVRSGEDLAAAESTLLDATTRLGALPVPEQLISAADVATAADSRSKAKQELDTTTGEIQRAQGRLEQVGGAVARERLRDVADALGQAERHEREIEADYEAWTLLLAQMKEADAAQASNLGQVLAPAIACRLQALTRQQYQGFQLDAHLGTGGLVVGGAVRDSGRISVGTREQVSTLYRLVLAEYLGTTIVLDDQLVQSDGDRMDWFRTMIAEKARTFQIIVFTCRPNDYLTSSSVVPEGIPVHFDSDEGFVRAIDFARAVRRR